MFLGNVLSELNSMVFPSHLKCPSSQRCVVRIPFPTQLFSDWTLSAADPDGNAIELAGRTSDVARRQPNGSWLMMIDNPWGGEHGFT